MPEGFSGSLDSQADASVHPIVRKTAAWSWRLLIILAALAAFFWVVLHLEVIVVPVLLATMVTAMLLPIVDFLDRRGLPRGAAVAAVLLTSVVVVGGMLTFVVSQFIQGAPALVEQVTLTITNARNSLNTGLLSHFSNGQIKSATDTAIEAIDAARADHTAEA